ncbi:MAG: pyroglutamyl-peptidase I [Clostridia bacterium]
MKRMLVSGFSKFAGFNENITEKLIRKLPDHIGKHDIHTIILPVEYEKGFDVMNDEIDRSKPDIVIATGMAYSRKKISIERLAVNIDHSDTADNAGVIRKDQIIDPKGEAAYFSTLEYDIKAYSSGFVTNSYSAGTYICNDLFYRLLSSRKGKDDPKISFIHFPGEENLAYEKQLSTFIEILSSLD